MMALPQTLPGPTCPHCAKRPRLRTGDYVSPTCTRSECQEAEYQASRDRNAPKRRDRKTALLTAATITDDQIRGLRKNFHTDNTLWLREFAVALGEVTTVNHPQEDRVSARARCAALLNDRRRRSR